MFWRYSIIGEEAQSKKKEKNRNKDSTAKSIHSSTSINDQCTDNLDEIVKDKSPSNNMAKSHKDKSKNKSDLARFGLKETESHSHSTDLAM